MVPAEPDLGCLHDRSIVHRDLKPPNVLLIEGEAGVDAKLSAPHAESSSQHITTHSGWRATNEEVCR